MEIKIENRKLIVNGIEIQLTNEQIKQLLNNPFARVERDECYYCISSNDEICSLTDDYDNYDTDVFTNANYFNDKKTAEQVMLHQQLYRRLLKFGYENNCIANSNENYTNIYCIFKDEFDDLMSNGAHYCRTQGTVYFTNEEMTDKAIAEIVEPFIQEHPDFIW